MTQDNHPKHVSHNEEKQTSDVNMDCQALESFIVDYIDGQLPSLQRKAFVDHIKECPPCKVYVTEYQKTIDLGKAAHTDPEPSSCEQMPEALVQAILSASKRP